MAHRFHDLGKAAEQISARRGKLRRAAQMLATTHMADPEAKATDNAWDCLEQYVKDLAACENKYSKAVGDADDAFIACLRDPKSDAAQCFEAYEIALDNADWDFDGCQAVIAAKWLDCFSKE
jgi:hypothetical protein